MEHSESDQSKREVAQSELTKTVISIHRLTHDLSQPVQEDKSRDLALLTQSFSNVDRLYHELPQGHHLEIAITPSAYYRLGGKERFLWLNQKISPGGDIQYLLKVGRFITDSDALPENKTVLNIAVLSKSDDLPRFSLQQVEKGNILVGESLSATELLKIQVVQDPPFPIKS